jgi:hypothetical protein
LNCFVPKFKQFRSSYRPRLLFSKSRFRRHRSLDFKSRKPRQVPTCLHTVNTRMNPWLLFPTLPLPVTLYLGSRRLQGAFNQFLNHCGTRKFKQFSFHSPYRPRLLVSKPKFRHRNLVLKIRKPHQMSTTCLLVRQHLPPFRYQVHFPQSSILIVGHLANCRHHLTGSFSGPRPSMALEIWTHRMFRSATRASTDTTISATQISKKVIQVKSPTL